VIRAGAEGDVTLALAPGQPPVVHADLDGFAFAVSAIASAVAVLDAVETRLGKTVSATWQAIDRGTCETNLAATVKGAPTLDFDALRRLASDAFGCAVQVVRLGASGFVASVVSIIASVCEDIVQAAFWAVELVRIVIEGLDRRPMPTMHSSDRHPCRRLITSQ